MVAGLCAYRVSCIGRVATYDRDFIEHNSKSAALTSTVTSEASLGHLTAAVTSLCHLTAAVTSLGHLTAAVTSLTSQLFSSSYILFAAFLFVASFFLGPGGPSCPRGSHVKCGFLSLYFFFFFLAY